MSKFMKVVWALVALLPLIFVIAIISLADFFKGQVFCKTIWIPIVLFIISILDIIVFAIMIRSSKKYLAKHKLGILEGETKDSEMATSLISYLLPLVSMTITDINVYALFGLLAILLFLLVCTRIIVFNPVIYLFGYKYYKIKVNGGVTYTLITKEKKFNPMKDKILVELFAELYLEV